MTERDLLAVVAASLAGSKVYQKILRDAQLPSDYNLLVKDAANLIAAVDAHQLRAQAKPYEKGKP